MEAKDMTFAANLKAHTLPTPVPAAAVAVAVVKVVGELPW